MITCEEARGAVEDALKILIRGEEIEASPKIGEAFPHIRECEEKDCRDLWLELDSLIIRKFDGE